MADDERGPWSPGKVLHEAEVERTIARKVVAEAIAHTLHVLRRNPPLTAEAAEAVQDLTLRLLYAQWLGERTGLLIPVVRERWVCSRCAGCGWVAPGGGPWTIEKLRSVQPGDPVVRAVKCQECNGTGYGSIEPTRREG